MLLYATDPSGEHVGQVWHTASGLRARPIGFTRWYPSGLRGIPFGNNAKGEIDILLLPGTHITTLLWQPDDDGVPPVLGLNLFFNGDKRNPGISIVAPYRRGMTDFRQNPALSTLSLYLETVGNLADRAFDDGRLRARVGAAFYMPSGGQTWQWRPSDFFNLDRVGIRDLEPDGDPDGVFVFELVVEGSARGRKPPAAAKGPAPRAAGPRGFPAYVDRTRPTALAVVTPVPARTAAASRGAPEMATPEGMPSPERGDDAPAVTGSPSAATGLATPDATRTAAAAPADTRPPARTTAARGAPSQSPAGSPTLPTPARTPPAASPLPSGSPSP